MGSEMCIRDSNTALDLLEEIYYHLIKIKNAVNEGLRLLGLLSIILCDTSNILNSKDDISRVKNLILSLNIDEKDLDVAGLTGLFLICKHLQIKEKYKQVPSRLKKIIKLRKNLTPQLVELRLSLGEKSEKLYSYIYTTPCLKLLDPIMLQSCIKDISSSKHIETLSLNRYEKEIIKLCFKFNQIVAKAIKITNRN